MIQGRIKWFNQQIGAGFIRSDEGENIFFKLNAIRGTDVSGLKRDIRVMFDVLKSGNGLVAANIRPAEMMLHEG